MTIINKGLDINENKSTLYHPLANIGDAIEYNNEQKIDLSNYMKEEIVLTKLSNYIAYLTPKQYISCIYNYVKTLFDIHK